MFLLAKTVQQVAALPFVPLSGGIEILLITSRHGGRWLLPKGWPSGKSTFADDAAREAREEAGIIGSVHRDPVGEYTYEKVMSAGYRVRSHVFVYPLLIREHRLDWPERDERESRWAALDEASGLVGDRDLAKLLDHLAQTGRDALHRAAAQLDAAPTTTASC